MKKKILTTLAIATLAITGLFAYDAPSVILTAQKAEVDYQFKVQKLNDEMNDYTDLVDGDFEIVSLDTTGGTTNAFTIATIAEGNMHDKIVFSTLVTTGEFLDQDDESIKSGWFPVIIDESSSATTTNKREEEVNYTLGNEGNFIKASTATYKTTFTRGKHLIGTEIARFKLQYKADNELIAGSYISTTTIDITTDKS